jgi:hypothetical protein
MSLDVDVDLTPKNENDSFEEKCKIDTLTTLTALTNYILAFYIYRGAC